MLAANRIESVIGRTKILKLSIIGKKGIKNVGVPRGNMNAKLEYGFFEYEDIIKDNHKGNASVNVIAKCLVVLKTYGIKPNILKLIIVINNEDTIKLKPPKFIL